MFTSTTASREKALLSSAAAERAMKRHECCKSQFKFRCFSCGEMINRGDKITKCTAPCWDGMRLRFRGADARNGLTMEETAFYLAETGTRTWVHVGCNPCYWDSLPEDSNEYSPPALRSSYTSWGDRIVYEFEEWRQLTNHYNMEEFLEKHGYPQEKWMKDRITCAVTRFQAIWRGYLYKQAYPLALEQKRATEAKRYSAFLEWCDTVPMHVFRSFPLFCQKNRAATGFQALWRGYICKIAYPEALLQAQAEQMYPPEMQAAVSEEVDSAFAYLNQKWLWRGEGEEDEPEVQSFRDQRVLERNGFLYQNSIGAHMEILMDKNHPSIAIYSAEVIKIQGQGGDGLYYWVKFHHDSEVRRYHWKKLLDLKFECETFKSKHGIQAKITGKLPLYRFIYP